MAKLDEAAEKAIQDSQPRSADEVTVAVIQADDTVEVKTTRASTANSLIENGLSAGHAVIACSNPDAVAVLLDGEVIDDEEAAAARIEDLEKQKAEWEENTQAREADMTDLNKRLNEASSELEEAKATIAEMREAAAEAEVNGSAS